MSKKVSAFALISLITFSGLFIYSFKSETLTNLQINSNLSIYNQVAAVSGAGSGLVAHYTFDEGSGNTANDSAGSNTGTVNGATWTSGKVGSGALSFDGVDDTVSIPSGSNLTLTTRTISLWLKPDVLSGIQGLIAENGYNYSVLLSNSNLQVYWHNGLGSPTYQSYGIGSSGAWKHVALVYDVSGSNVTISAYQNGSLLGTYSDTNGFTSKGPIIGIGHNAGYRFKGLIDDVRIYDRALSSEEISQLSSMASVSGESENTEEEEETTPETENPATEPPVSSGPQIYYVDYESGNDQNNGTSKTTPWKHSPGDVSATGNAGSAVLSPGDRVKFKGGVVYYGGIVISKSGTSNNPIIYDGNFSNDWGSGRAVMDRSFLNNSSIIKLSRKVSHVQVKGFELRNAGGYADNDQVVIDAALGLYGNSVNAIKIPRPGTGVDMYEGENHNVLLEDLYIHHIGIWHSTQGWNGRAISGTGILLASPTSLTIKDCELTKIGSVGIALYAPRGDVKDVLITDCYLHDNIPQWGIDVAPMRVGAVMEDVTIMGSRFENLWSNWSGTADDPSNSGTTAPHQNYIFIRQALSASVWKNFTIEGNWFGETRKPTVGVGGTGAIFLSQGPSVNIYNNVFARNWSITGTVVIGYPVMSGMKQVVRIYNNTFHRGTGSLITIAQRNPPGTKEVYIENNLFVNPTGQAANHVLIAADEREAIKALNYNMYWSPEWSVDQMYLIVNEGWKRYKDVQQIGFEANGHYADPLFVDDSNQNWGARSYKLQSNSPAIGKGKNLSQFFTKDFDGKRRPSSGAWTIGAYEYTGATTNPEPEPEIPEEEEVPEIPEEEQPEEETPVPNTPNTDTNNTNTNNNQSNTNTNTDTNTINTTNNTEPTIPRQNIIPRTETPNFISRTIDTLTNPFLPRSSTGGISTNNSNTTKLPPDLVPTGEDVVIPEIERISWLDYLIQTIQEMIERILRGLNKILGR